MSKRIIIINGSPRKNGNTATLLQNVINGARACNALVEMINLYDLNYKGCISCFACKLKGGKSYGKCAMQDDLTPILEKIKHADALVLGSPIYLLNVTGEMRSFIERLLFPYLVYDVNRSSLFRRKIKTALILTMGADEKRVKDNNLKIIFDGHVALIERILGKCQTLYSMNTYQFDDYSKYEYSMSSVEEKIERRKTVFKDECKKAYEIGKDLSKGEGVKYQFTNL